MPCYRPLKAWQVKHSDGSSSISLKDPYAKESDVRVGILLPCGKCVGCRVSRSRQWAIRCVHEAQLHDENCFITLTFSDPFLNKDEVLVKADFQNFMKRLRKFVDVPVKFYHCGEYGSEGGRPHHHACIFGFDFPDKRIIRDTGRYRLYRSDMLERLWSVRVSPDRARQLPAGSVRVEDGKFYACQGFCTVGDVTAESASYVAGYVAKGGRREYNSSSVGIGKEWFEKYSHEVYPEDVLLFGGCKVKPPRYYDVKHKAAAPDVHAEIVARRVAKAKESPDNTDKRLRARERVAHAKLNIKKRSL